MDKALISVCIFSYLVKSATQCTYPDSALLILFQGKDEVTVQTEYVSRICFIVLELKVQFALRY